MLMSFSLLHQRSFDSTVRPAALTNIQNLYVMELRSVPKAYSEAIKINHFHILVDMMAEASERR